MGETFEAVICGWSSVSAGRRRVSATALGQHAPGARDWFGEEAGRVASAHENATLQAGYFFLAARAAGLGVGPMSGFDASGVDAEFLADTAWRSFMVVTLGVPAEENAWHPRSPRMDFEEVFHEV